MKIQYIKENKLSIIFDTFVIMSLFLMEQAPKGYYIILILCSFLIVFRHFSEYLSKAHMNLLREVNRENEIKFLSTIENLISELNYPALSEEQKLELIADFNKMKFTILLDHK